MRPTRATRCAACGSASGTVQSVMRMLARLMGGSALEASGLQGMRVLVEPGLKPGPGPPVMRLREELPAPQARAMRVDFGGEDGPSVEPFLVVSRP